MRNRQLIVHWLMAHTAAIDVRRREGKTYYVHDRCRRRSARASAGCSPKCSGSRARATTRRRASCSRRYGVHFDPALRDEVVARVDALDLPSYTAFVMPRLDAGASTTARSSTSRSPIRCDLEAQMLEYSALHARSNRSCQRCSRRAAAAHSSSTRSRGGCRAACALTGAAVRRSDRVESDRAGFDVSADAARRRCRRIRGACATSRSRSAWRRARAAVAARYAAARRARSTPSTSCSSASTSEATRGCSSCCATPETRCSCRDRATRCSST